MENPKNNPKLPTSSGEAAGQTVIQRWSAARKREVVLRLLRGESLDAVSREIGVEVYRLERWRDKALVVIRPTTLRPDTRYQMAGR
jgi:transposase-like protein